jgi:hypothetical protein
MNSAAITAHAPLDLAEAQASVLAWFDDLGLELAYAEGDLLIAWLDDAIDPYDEGFVGAPSLVVEAKIHSLREGVQVRCSVHHGEGSLDATLAAEADRGLRRCLNADKRWVMDNRSLRRR